MPVKVKKHSRQLPITERTRFIISEKKQGAVYSYWTPMRGSCCLAELTDAFYDLHAGEYAIFPIGGGVLDSGKRVFGKIYRYVRVSYLNNAKKIEIFDAAGRVVQL